MTLPPPTVTISANDPGGSYVDRTLTVLMFLGFVVPNAMVAASFGSGGGVGSYFGAWVASIPSTQLLVDLALCSAAFFMWAADDARRLGIRWWPIIPATFLVGLCFAIPLYLRSRGRHIAQINRTSQGRDVPQGS